MNFQEAMEDKNLKNAMDEEIKAIKKNNTCEPASLLSGYKAIDDLIFIGSNSSMVAKFKKEMTKEFEMTDIGLMCYYFSIEVKQEDKGILITHEGYAKEVLKKFKMDDINPVGTPVECGIKLSKHKEGEKVDPTFFKNLVGSLRYLTCTRLDILYAVEVISRYMENPITIHLKVAKKILRYLRGTISFDSYYSTSDDNKLVGYSDNDWSGDIDDHKSTSGFVFYLGATAFTWMSKKQPIITLCEQITFVIVTVHLIQRKHSNAVTHMLLKGEDLYGKLPPSLAKQP
ncbi:uncharacterized mitochondrial protein AtMg00810-like [Ziziphus jujuba]|uniref:Uncharacterized mitochondrial protein AtMg00810-like n=1 Tax=Ziziphus jujuba TaxID=326968 RepID=A0ABM3ZY93_ZIZJJ|nr:uncharacterized mitochondrial protein AtMg00810-like [Ziziphus jujuba]